MSLSEILSTALSTGGSWLAVILVLIQIAPIPINPWKWITKKIGHAVNGEVIEKVNQLGADLQALRQDFEERGAAACRIRIMRFGDEILHGVHHSKEHFDQILIDVTTYEGYCREHPTFRNNIAVETIERIKQVYQDCWDDRTFL